MFVAGGVQIISNYLETKFDMDPSLISETKLTEMLKNFSPCKAGLLCIEDREGKKTITVLDLYKHVSELYNKDKDSFKTIIKAKIAENTESEKNFSPLP